MRIPKVIAAMAAGSLMLLAAGAAAQNGAPQEPAEGQGPGFQRLVLPELARLDWIENSAVAALREGVLEKMELQIGMPVKAGGTIGYLHRKFAELTVTKAQRQAESTGPQEKAQAEVEVATAVVARDRILNARKPDMVAAEEAAKHVGEYKVAIASSHEAREKQAIDKADYDLAVQTLDEHTIKAPFDGIITKRMKDPGESVRANEAVVELGNLNRLAADCYVSIEYAYRVKEGQAVEIQPRSKSAHAAAGREEAVPRQDHLRRPRDPAGRRDRRADPGRVREPRLGAEARPRGAVDHLPPRRLRRG